MQAIICYAPGDVRVESAPDNQICGDRKSDGSKLRGEGIFSGGKYLRRLVLTDHVQDFLKKLLQVFARIKLKTQNSKPFPTR